MTTIQKRHFKESEVTADNIDDSVMFEATMEENNPYPKNGMETRTTRSVRSDKVCFTL